MQLAKRWLSLVTGLAALSSCEESLPPRIDPSSILPSDFLETTFSFSAGNVVFAGDTFPAAGGIFWVTAKNLYDEVLQARSDIQLDIDYHLLNFAAPMEQVHGDSNNLINRYNFNGKYFMHQKGLLTIEPESTATFIISLDHKGDQWWNLGNPSVIPGNNGGIFTDQMEFSASGTISLFKGYAPVPLDQISGTFLYQFLNAQLPLYANSLMISVNNEGLVQFEWVQLEIPFNAERFIGFRVQRAVTDTHLDYVVVSDGIASSPFLDNPPQGTWYYRLAQVAKRGPWNSVIAITAYSDGLRIDVP